MSGSAARAQSTLDPFARGSWHLELGGHAAIETWNYNISHEEMAALVPGFTYGLPKGLVLRVTWPLYYVDQRGVDAWLLGATVGVRGRLWRYGRLTAFWEVEVGLSEADTLTPPRGTRFNYLALGGGGVLAQLRGQTYVVAGLKWMHLSNNGLAGRARNPDIEAVGPQLALLARF